MRLPKLLNEKINNFTWEENTVGHSESQVFLLKGLTYNCYLKIQPSNSIDRLIDEKRKLEWLQGRVPVPEVLFYEIDDTNEYLLMSEIKGNNAADPSYQTNAKDVMVSLGEGLKQIHQLSLDQCPFQLRLDKKISEAYNRVKSGLVDVYDFDEIRKGKDPNDLYKELVNNRPVTEDIVFTHGDYCLPNIILHNGVVSGFIDLGRAGVADRYQDLALAIRSITYNFGMEYVPYFLEAYGLDELDNQKVEYYQLLDEFF
jgi:aminoglycoside phosphotransferase